MPTTFLSNLVLLFLLSFSLALASLPFHPVSLSLTLISVGETRDEIGSVTFLYFYFNLSAVQFCPLQLQRQIQMAQERLARLRKQQVCKAPLLASRSALLTAA